MTNKSVKKILIAVLAATSLPLIAQAEISNEDLRLVEELPVAVRQVVHATVLEFLKNNPQALDEDSVIAVDKKGAIYVIDKKSSNVISLGAPSCVRQ